MYYTRALTANKSLGKGTSCISPEGGRAAARAFSATLTGRWVRKEGGRYRGVNTDPAIGAILYLVR
jgi:hypothetical protein